MYLYHWFAVIGKAEGTGKSLHGHVSAVTVAPPYRRQGLAKRLMDLLEDVTIERQVRGLIAGKNITPRVLVYDA